MKRGRKPVLWKTLEEQMLVELYRRGLVVEEIARKLCRSTPSTNNYIWKHRDRLGLKKRYHKRTVGEQRLVAREVEMTFKRIEAGMPYRSRGSIAQAIIHYCLDDSKVRRVKASNENVLDLGGMLDRNKAQAPNGIARKPFKPRKRAA